MSFKTTGPKTRPERAKPPPPPASPSTASPTLTTQPKSHRRTSDASSTTSTHSTASFHSAHFPPTEEAAMIDASHTLKTSANTQFTAGDYSSAIGTYDRAVAELPTYLDYELAVLQSNIAACHLKLEQWREALDACEKGLGGLEREMPTKKKEKKEKKKQGEEDDAAAAARKRKGGDGEAAKGGKRTVGSDEDGQVVELPDDADDEALQAQLHSLTLSDARRADIKRIRIKLLLRRARARSSLTPVSWSHLAGALEDYTQLTSAEYMPQLPVADQRTVRQALVELPPRVEEAKQREVGEMMGKLKEVGNGILRPFGLSTDMFKMTQDPGTGGWSMAFDQAGGKKGGGGGGGGGGNE